MRKLFSRIGKRPIIFIFILIATIPLCVVEQFNPYMNKYGSMSIIASQNYMTNLANLADSFSVAVRGSLRINALTVLIGLLFVVALSLILGVFFGGYFQTLYLAVNDVPKKKNDFKLGINRHFAKLTVYFFVLIITAVLLGILILFSAVPFVMHLQMFLQGDSSVIFKMMLLAILTVLFGYFTIVFYCMYMSYMIPALVGFKKGGIMVSFKMTNGYCWYLMPRTTLFLFLMLALKVVMLILGYGTATGLRAAACFGVNWIFTALILFGYLYYVFDIFTVMKEDMFTAEGAK